MSRLPEWRGRRWSGNRNFERTLMGYFSDAVPEKRPINVRRVVGIRVKISTMYRFCLGDTNALLLYFREFQNTS